jgi:hypothetical protein
VKRPGGISILALLLLVYGAALAVQIAVLLTRPDLWTGFTDTPLLRLTPGGRADAEGILWVSGVGAAVSLLLAFGLWFQKGAARWGLLAAAAIPVAQGLLGAVAILATDVSRWREIGDAFWFETIVLGALAYYLFRPEVQRAFGRRDRFSDEFDRSPEYDRD